MFSFLLVAALALAVHCLMGYGLWHVYKEKPGDRIYPSHLTEVQRARYKVRFFFWEVVAIALALYYLYLAVKAGVNALQGVYKTIKLACKTEGK